jgi:hypothetical protein
MAGSLPKNHCLPAEDNCLGNRNNVGVQCEALAESAFYAHQHKEPQLTILNSLQSFPPIPPLHPLSEDALKEILAENLNPNNNDQETEKLMRDFKTSRPTLLPLVKKILKKSAIFFKKLEWTFGINRHVPFINLSTDNQKSIFYCIGHTAVVYSYEHDGKPIEPRQILFEGLVSRCFSAEIFIDLIINFLSNNQFRKAKLDWKNNFFTQLHQFYSRCQLYVERNCIANNPKILIFFKLGRIIFFCRTDKFRVLQQRKMAAGWLPVTLDRTTQPLSGTSNRMREEKLSKLYFPLLEICPLSPYHRIPMRIYCRPNGKEAKGLTSICFSPNMRFLAMLSAGEKQVAN